MLELTDKDVIAACKAVDSAMIHVLKDMDENQMYWDTAKSAKQFINMAEFKKVFQCK